MKGITLEPGTIVVLTLDGTMVYVEEMTTTFAAVVALPEQPTERSDDRVFTPGRVGIKKISPFATCDRVVPVVELSDRNKNFIGDYEKLRAEHGSNYVALTDEEKAAMSVVKVGPKVRTPKPDAATKKAEREAERTKRKDERDAARKAAAAPVTCAACDAGHHLTDTGLHYAGADETAPLWGVCTKLLAAVNKRAAKAGTPRAVRAPREAKAAGPVSALKYRIAVDGEPATVLATAVTQKDKFKDGNRGHKVFLGLRVCPEHTGTVAEVMTKVAEVHGATWCSDPEAIVGRALKELSRPEFGAVTVLVK